MLQHIQKMNLVFENCEVIQVELEHIRDLQLTGISQRLVGSLQTGFHRYLEVEEFELVLKGSIRHDVASRLLYYEIDELDNFERIQKYHNLVYVMVTYHSNDEERIDLPWDDEANSWFYNRFETHTYDEERDELTIRVSPYVEEIEEEDA